MSEQENVHWGRVADTGDSKVVNLGTWGPGNTEEAQPQKASVEAEASPQAAEVEKQEAVQTKPKRPYRKPVNRKFSDEEATSIRARRASGEKVAKLATEFGCCRHTIQRLCAARYYPASN